MSAGAALDAGRAYFDTEEGREYARLMNQQLLAQQQGMSNKQWGGWPNLVRSRQQRSDADVDAWQAEQAKAWDANPPTDEKVSAWQPTPWQNATAAVRGDDPRGGVPGVQYIRNRAADVMQQAGDAVADQVKANITDPIKDVYAGLAESDWRRGVAGAMAFVPMNRASAVERAAVRGERSTVAEARTAAQQARMAQATQNPIVPTPAQALPELERTYNPASPAIVSQEDIAATRAILAHAEQQRTPKYPTAKEPVFTIPDDGGRAETLERVPQVSRRGELPAPPPGTNRLPLNDRSRPLIEHAQEIGESIANDLRDAPSATGKPRQFYYTGPVLKGMEEKAGLSPDEAREFMEDWSGQGSGTSPRTKTPSNLRNASYLLWRGAQGDPLTAEKRAAEGNVKGFPMMDMHAELADQFAHGRVNPWQNPKPYTFQGNWAGNLQDVTGDTHYIRGTLAKLDELYPGTIPREWFASDKAFKAYKDRGGFGPGVLPKINDKLGSAVIGAKGDRRKAQIEYGAVTDPGYIAAQQLGIAPAEAQSQMWFHYGPRTGLRSPAASIPDLLNSQIEETARVTGMHPEKILQLWTRGRIPLASNEGTPSSSAVG